MTNEPNLCPFDEAKNPTLLFRSPMGDEVYLHAESMIVRLMGRRGVVSTSNLSGGYRTDLRYVFNHSCGRDLEIQQKRCPGLRGRNIAEHYTAIATDLGLPPDTTTGMGTAALIENHAVASRSYHGVEVLAVATAGVDVNGGRAGDKASYDEFERKSLLPPAGTINIFLFVNARLDGGALTRAIVTATEAKTAALQELMAPSLYSEGLATGSGTDSVIAICNDESETTLYNAGKHVLLGEMIGQSVKQAVTEALAKQTGMTPERQASLRWQGKRYGITCDSLASLAFHAHPEADLEALRVATEYVDRQPIAVATMVAVLHLVDQYRWGMVSGDALRDASQSLLDSLLRGRGLPLVDIGRVRKHPVGAMDEAVLADLRLALAHVIYCHSVVGS